MRGLLSICKLCFQSCVVLFCSKYTQHRTWKDGLEDDVPFPQAARKLSGPKCYFFLGGVSWQRSCYILTKDRCETVHPRLQIPSPKLILHPISKRNSYRCLGHSHRIHGTSYIYCTDPWSLNSKSKANGCGTLYMSHGILSDWLVHFGQPI